MNFVSIEFALASLVFFPLYWGLRPYRRAQMFFLTLSGYALYYTWSVNMVIMLAVYSLCIWLAGRWINAGAEARKPRARLAVSILLAVSVLAFYKYYDLIQQTASDALQGAGLSAFLPVLDILTPVGISFFTFQAITYLVWQGKETSGVQRVSLGQVLLYLGFMPTHFAGPIFRADDFFGQLRGEQVGAPKAVPRAIYIILLGLAQKLVFATWLEGAFVTEAFKYPDAQGAISTVMAVIAYSLQIFMDFSGYTLIVTGIGLLLGFEVPLNFRQPYLATSLRDFWRRWHITLSFFIRDYIYIPLGGNRCSNLRAQFNLMVAMVLSGFWHGASWTFLLWGALHGIGAVFQHEFEKVFGRNRLPAPLAQLITLLFVGFAWVFFRSHSPHLAWALLGGLGRGMGAFTMQDAWLLAFSVLFLLLSARSDAIERATVAWIGRNRGLPAIAAATAVMYCIILFGPSGVPDFIYYKF